MTQPISRRSVAKAGVWSAPVIAASVAVPAYAASTRSEDSDDKLTIQSGLFVSAQYGGGFVGYASSTSTGPIHPTTPEAYFASSSKPESDLNWDDSASKPTNPDLFINGEGTFTPVNNSQTASPGSYVASSGFWWSVPTTAPKTGTGYVAGSTATLAAGATFVTDVEYTVPANALNAAKSGRINGQAWTPNGRALSGRLTELVASAGQARYLSVAQAAGNWSASVPTVTQNSDGTYTFKGRITFTTTKAYTLKQTGNKLYGQVVIMPGIVSFSPAQGWVSYKQTSSIQNATITYSGNGYTDTKALSGAETTTQINP